MRGEYWWKYGTSGRKKWSGCRVWGMCSVRLDSIPFIWMHDNFTAQNEDYMLKMFITSHSKEAFKVISQLFQSDFLWDYSSIHQLFQREIMILGVNEVYISACCILCVITWVWLCFWDVFQNECSESNARKMYVRRKLQTKSAVRAFRLKKRLIRTKNDSPEWWQVGVIRLVAR